MPDDQVDLDARTLKALAHPVRVRLLGLLRTEGPSTATRLGESLGLNSGATSYHLRQLAAAGLVADDPGHRDGRERWWAAAHRFTHFEFATLAPEDRPLGDAYLHLVADAYADRLRAGAAARGALPPEWDLGMTLSDTMLALTPEEAQRLLADVDAVLARYRQADPGPTPEGTRRVSFLWAALPDPQGGSAGRDRARRAGRRHGRHRRSVPPRAGGAAGGGGRLADRDPHLGRRAALVRPRLDRERDPDRPGRLLRDGPVRAGTGPRRPGGGPGGCPADRGRWRRGERRADRGGAGAAPGGAAAVLGPAGGGRAAGGGPGAGRHGRADARARPGRAGGGADRAGGRARRRGQPAGRPSSARRRRVW